MHDKKDPAPPRSPESLVRSIATGRDREAFKELFRFYAPRIQTMLIRSGATSEIAEDIAQETLIAVWRKAESYDPDRATASAWIYTIARNLRIDRFRRDQRAKLYEIYEFVEQRDAPPPDIPFEAAERQSQIRKALDGLAEDQARVIELSFFEGRAHGEIARRLGIPLGTVKSRLRLAISRLREFLGESR